MDVVLLDNVVLCITGSVCTSFQSGHMSEDIAVGCGCAYLPHVYYNYSPLDARCSSDCLRLTV